MSPLKIWLRGGQYDESSSCVFIASKQTGTHKGKGDTRPLPIQRDNQWRLCVEMLEAEASLKAQGKTPRRIHHKILPSRTSCHQNGKDIKLSHLRSTCVVFSGSQVDKPSLCTSHQNPHPEWPDAWPDVVLTCWPGTNFL